jgi:small-conductance mechanosensitive channel
LFNPSSKFIVNKWWRKKGKKEWSFIANCLRKSHLFDDEDLVHIIARTSSVVSYSLISIALLGTFGVDTKPFIAGIGVTGFAAGFALKEIATNYISGVLLVFSKPFKKGEYIKIIAGGGLEGEVESIEIRHVVLKTKDDALLMIPSALVYSNPIVILPKN